MKTKLIILFIVGFIITNIFFFDDKNISLFKASNSYYKEGKYNESIKILNDLYKPENDNINDKILYNLGNNFYKKSIIENSGKIELLKKSLDYYTKSIEVKYDKKTEKNIEFIKQVLKQERQKQEKEENNQNKQEGDNKDQNKKEQNQNNSGTGFTKEQEKSLKDYENNLKQEQLEIGKNYNKKIEDQNDSFDIFDAFFEHDSDFNNNQDLSEKDW